MLVDLSPYEIRLLLSWSHSSPQGMYEALGGLVGTLRDVTLADRLRQLLESSGPPDARRDAIADAESLALRVVREELAAVQPDLERAGLECAYLGVVHSVPASDPRYWSVVDVQIERRGAERPTYEMLSTDIPVWREGAACIGDGGEELRGWVRALLGRWLVRAG